MGNAAKLTRKHLFSNHTLFDGDLSEEKQSVLVLSRLLHLLALILDCTTDYQKISAGTKITCLLGLTYAV